MPLLRARRWSVLPLLLLASGCPRDGQPEVAPPDTLAVVSPRDEAAVPEAAKTVELQPLAGEALTAQATLVPIATRTQVTVQVLQGPPNTGLTAHLLTGSCEQPGAVAADLQPLTTDAAGQGRSETVVDLDPAQVLNGNHIMQLRRENGRAGVPAACGAIPAHPVLHDGG